MIGYYSSRFPGSSSHTVITGLVWPASSDKIVRALLINVCFKEVSTLWRVENSQGASCSYLTLLFLEFEPEWAIDSVGERNNNCFSKIQLVGQKYRDKTTLASKTRFSCHYFGFQSQCFSLLVGYNKEPSSSSTNQNAALIIAL